MSVILLATSCFIFIFIFRQIDHHEKISQELERQWQDETSKREEIKSLDRMLEANEAERVLLNSHFIKNPDVAPFLDVMERLAPTVGAAAEVAQVDIPKDNSGLVVGINASGSFESLYRFISLLGNSSYELEILAMDLSQSPGIESDKWSVVLKVKLLSFIP